MQIIGAYIDEDGKPILRESYCFFLDFLGFSSLVQSATSLVEEQELLDKFVKDVSPHIDEATKPQEYDYGLDGKLFWGAKIFTDNIVLGYPSRTPEKETELGSALFDAMSYQLGCVLSGYFVRGGLSYGNLCIAESVVFGKALLEAVGLEKQAGYPRIVVGDSVKEITRQHMSFYGRPNDSPHSKTFLTDHEGAWFLNYLMWLAEDEFIDRTGLKLHKETIELMLITYSGDEKIRSKYLWVAEYHNWFCRSYYDEDGDIEAFAISGISDNCGIRSVTEDELE
jgi:hypothetical protein